MFSEIFHVLWFNLILTHKSQRVDLDSSRRYCPNRRSSPQFRPDVSRLYISWCRAHSRMPIPLRIFGCFAIYFRFIAQVDPINVVLSDIIKVNLSDVTKGGKSAIIDALSDPDHWQRHPIDGRVVCRNGNIFCLHPWCFVITSFPPSHHSHRNHGTAEGESQTSKISNLPLGPRRVRFYLNVSRHKYVLR